MVIRIATVNDIDTLCEMGSRFLAFAPHGKHVNTTAEDYRSGCEAFMRFGTVFIAERDGKACAMLACAIMPVWFAPSILMAHELAWWVDEDARGSSAAVRLVRAFEEFARESGARIIAMSQLHAVNGEQVGRMLNKLGYEASETTYIKGA